MPWILLGLGVWYVWSKLGHHSEGLQGQALIDSMRTTIMASDFMGSRWVVVSVAKGSKPIIVAAYEDARKADAYAAWEDVPLQRGDQVFMWDLKESFQIPVASRGK